MKKFISTLFILTMCISLCSCSCSKQDITPAQKADFSRTAGIWYESGSPYAAKLEMNGAGAVTSYYPEDEGVEFDGYLGYDSTDDVYSIFTSDDEFISEFTFDSDTQLHIGDDTEHIYVKSDETLTSPALVSEFDFGTTSSLISNDNYNGGYFYSDKTADGVTVKNVCRTSDISGDEFTEMYIVRCIGEICDKEIDSVTINEATEYRDKLLHQVYLVSWTADNGSEQWDMFFFTTNTHTYMYSLSAPVGTLSDAKLQSIFDSLHLSEAQFT